MSCPGLHCPGCTGGQSLGILAAVVGAVVVADEAVQWVAERIWWIGGTLAVCFALSVAAAIMLGRWADRRDARRDAAWRAMKAAQAPAVVTVHATPVTSAERPALGFRDLHIHLDGVPSAEQAAVIRQAINGRTSQ